MKKQLNKEKSYTKIIYVLIACFCLFFISGVVLKPNKNDKLKGTDRNKMTSVANTESEDEEEITIEGVIKDTSVLSKPSYNNENKHVSIVLEFKSKLGNENGISIANNEVYKIVKAVESEFPKEIERYIFSFEHKLVDKYGNPTYKSVYSLYLDKEEIEKINWDGITSDMLVDLATNVYKHQDLK